MKSKAVPTAKSPIPANALDERLAGESDEMMARRLAESVDIELAQRLRQQDRDSQLALRLSQRGEGSDGYSNLRHSTQSLNAGQTFTALKFDYDVRSQSWHKSTTSLKISPVPFASGEMRVAYRADEILGVDMVSSVVKVSKSNLQPSQFYFDEGMTQMVAESYAQDFNRLCVAHGLPNRISFLPVSVLQFTSAQGGLALVEPFLPGEYVKQSNHTGLQSVDMDETARAFVYYTFVASNHLLVVCNIQGVGSTYTDPQIHTHDSEGFGVGNLGAQGIQRVLSAHVHGALCEKLELPPPAAQQVESDIEMALRLQENEYAATASPPPTSVFGGVRTQTVAATAGVVYAGQTQAGLGMMQKQGTSVPLLEQYRQMAAAPIIMPWELQQQLLAQQEAAHRSEQRQRRQQLKAEAERRRRQEEALVRKEGEWGFAFETRVGIVIDIL
jgi:myosin-heavy-chain kinase